MLIQEFCGVEREVAKQTEDQLSKFCPKLKHCADGRAETVRTCANFVDVSPQVSCNRLRNQATLDVFFLGPFAL